MTRITTAAIAALFVFGAGAPAEATQLINQDSDKYDVVVNNGSSTTRFTINGRTTRGACSSSTSECTIEVDGVGEITVSGSTDVLIKGGELEED